MRGTIRKIFFANAVSNISFYASWITYSWDGVPEQSNVKLLLKAPSWIIIWGVVNLSILLTAAYLRGNKHE